MNRREALIAMGSAGLGIGLASYAVANRSNFSRQFVQVAQPKLIRHEHEEIRTIPAVGRERIKRWFDGKALNCGRFATNIASWLASENLESLSSSDRDLYVQRRFFHDVVMPSQIRHAVELSATDVGTQMDLTWSQCCQEIAEVSPS